MTEPAVEPAAKRMEGCFAYLCWEVENVVADHEGYCSDAENDETITREDLWVRYAIDSEDLQQLRTLQNEDPHFFEMFNLMMSKPRLSNDQDDVRNDGDSFYCRESEHGLKHERMRIPLRVINFSLKEKPWAGQSNQYGLSVFLCHVRTVNVCVQETLCGKLSKDIIRLICGFVWTTN